VVGSGWKSPDTRKRGTKECMPPRTFLAFFLDLVGSAAFLFLPMVLELCVAVSAARHPLESQICESLAPCATDVTLLARPPLPIDPASRRETVHETPQLPGHA
jgi:hypothetical protein